ncbi:hypothetical protein ABT354_36035 [Streptomyces sp. NPDC000594]|uniref:hypothetical protein n=1 Tax=Streptomyces sp. NPDC000594 TaxID=3154261 RepID=UPI00331ABC63
MRHNGRAPVLASLMPPEHLSLRDGEPPLAVCSECGAWRRLTRSMITPHRAADAAPHREERRYLGDKPYGGRRCPGSGQRITLDLSVERWGELLLAAETTAASRRTTHPVRKPRPEAPPATARMSTATRTARERLAAHLQDRCVRCQRAGTASCPVVIGLRQEMSLAEKIAAAPAAPIYSQLRTALHQHRTTCTQCTGDTPCPAGRSLAARITAHAHQHLRNTRPELYRTRPPAAPIAARLRENPVARALGDELTAHQESGCIYCRAGRCLVAVGLRQRVRRATALR